MSGQSPSWREVIYLHGFASSPESYKSQHFSRALRERGIRVQVPDLNEGDFRNLTVSRQLALLDRLTADRPAGSVVLIGSSLGAYTAALFAARSDKVAALVLMAPAFDFGRRWREREGAEVMRRWKAQGQMALWHFGSNQEEQIGYGLIEDAETHPAFPAVTIPTLVMHGRQDDVVDPELSVRFAADRPNVELELVDADHTLGEVVDWLIERSLRFLDQLPA